MSKLLPKVIVEYSQVDQELRELVTNLQRENHNLKLTLDGTQKRVNVLENRIAKRNINV
jgi:hypothetical protein